MAENENPNSIFEMLLDTNRWVASIQQALDQYTAFRAEVTKSLNVHIDKESVNALGKAFKVAAQDIVKGMQGAATSSVQQLERVEAASRKVRKTVAQDSKAIVHETVASARQGVREIAALEAEMESSLANVRRRHKVQRTPEMEELDLKPMTVKQQFDTIMGAKGKAGIAAAASRIARGEQIQSKVGSRVNDQAEALRIRMLTQLRDLPGNLRERAYVSLTKRNIDPFDTATFLTGTGMDKEGNTKWGVSSKVRALSDSIIGNYRQIASGSLQSTEKVRVASEKYAKELTKMSQKLGELPTAAHAKYTPEQMVGPDGGINFDFYQGQKDILLGQRDRERQAKVAGRQKDAARKQADQLVNFWRELQRDTGGLEDQAAFGEAFKKQFGFAISRKKLPPSQLMDRLFYEDSGGNVQRNAEAHQDLQDLFSQFGSKDAQKAEYQRIKRMAERLLDPEGFKKAIKQNLGVDFDNEEQMTGALFRKTSTGGSAKIREAFDKVEDAFARHLSSSVRSLDPKAHQMQAESGASFLTRLSTGIKEDRFRSVGGVQIQDSFSAADLMTGGKYDQRKFVQMQVLLTDALNAQKKILAAEHDELKARNKIVDTENKIARFEESQLHAYSQLTPASQARISRSMQRTHGVDVSQGGAAFFQLKDPKAGTAGGVSPLSGAQAVFARQVSDAQKLEKSLGVVNGHLVSGAKNGNSLADSITRSATQFARWFIMYRLVGNVMMQVQQISSQIVQNGLEYIRLMETQQLGLRGILAENYHIFMATTDTNKEHRKTFEGIAAINVLQQESVKQWNQIQKSALAVVGTTEDLMMLYNGILPHAAKLGKTTADIQKLVKDTAVAASLMDISFNDARSALVSLLQGRNLQKNRLVAALGIGTDELKALKGTPALFDRISQSLEAFGEMSNEAQNTFAALKESFGEFIARIGGEALRPAMEMFKEITNGLRDMLFDDTSLGLELKPETIAFFTFLKGTMNDVLEPVRQFGGELANQAGRQIPAWVIALGHVIKAFVELGLLAAKAVLAIGEFIAKNESFIRLIGKLAGLALIVSIVLKLRNAMLALATANSGLSGIISSIITRFSLFFDCLRKGEGPISSTRSALIGLGATLKTVFIGGIITAVIAGLTYLVQHIMAVKDASDKVQKSLKSWQQPDQMKWATSYTEAMTAARSPKQEADVLLGSLWPRMERVKAKVPSIQIGGQPAGLTTANLEEKLTGYRADQSRISKDLAAAQKDYAAAPANSEERKKLYEQIRKLRKQLADYRLFENDVAQVLSEITETASHKTEVDDLFSRLYAGKDANGRTYTPQERPSKQQLGDLLNLQTDLSRNRVLSETLKQGSERAWDLGMESSVVTEPKLKDKDTAWDDNFKRKMDEIKEIVQYTVMKITAERDQDKKGWQEYFDDVLNIEQWGLAEERKLWEERKKDYAGWVKEENARRAKKGEEPVSDNAQRKEYDTIQIELLRVSRQMETRAQQARTELYKHNKEIEQELEAFGTRVSGKQAEIFGDQSEKVVTQLTKMQNDAREIIAKGVNEKQLERLRGFIETIEKVKDPAARKEDAEQMQKSGASRYEFAKGQEDQLAQSLEAGVDSIDHYVKRLMVLRGEQRQALNDQIAAVRSLLAIEQGRETPNEDNVLKLKAQLEQLATTLRDVESLARASAEAFAAWGNLSSSINELVGMFEVLSGSVRRVADSIQRAVSAARVMGNIGRTGRAFAGQMGAFQAATKATLPTGATAGGIGGFSALMSVLSGTKPSATRDYNFMVSQNSPKPYTYEREVPGSTSNESTAIETVNASTLASKSFGGFMAAPAVEAGKAASQGMASVMGKISKFAGPIGMGLSAALSIGSAIFAAAVKKNKEKIEKSFKDISDGISDGTYTLGQGLEKAQYEQEKATKEMSKSKAGRAALKDMEQQMKDQIRQIQQQIKNVRKSFEDNLKGLMAGGGPFGDFARQLFDLEKQTKEYLDTFTKDSPDYVEALEKVTQMFDITLQNAKESFKEQMRGYESEALSSIEQVFDLVDQQADQYRQLRDLQDQKNDLKDEEIELQDAINDRAKKEAELRKKIADTMRDAAKQESDIRRRGVLEAQLSVAEQKANEIRQVRDDAREEVDSLNDQLQDLLKDKSLEKRKRDLGKEKENLALQEEKLLENITLTGIRLEGARAIAAVEEKITGHIGSRAELVKAQTALEIAGANAQVWKWQQTKALIDSINKQGDHFTFNPPSGFPPITVQIGNITISNQNTAITTPPSGPGSGGNGGGGREPNPGPGRGGRQGDNWGRRGYQV